MNFQPLFEKAALVILGLMTLVALYLASAQPLYFSEEFLREDGWIENLTACLLFASGVTLGARLWSGRLNGWRFLVVTGLGCLAFLFVAGEEISWGQRIFQVESSEFFKKNNAQAETNLHNLEVGGVKINKLIFGQLLTVLIIIYILIWPWLYRQFSKIKITTDQLFVPLPRLVHSIAYLLVSLAILFMEPGKKWELLEFASALIFYLILINPLNRAIYQGK